MHTLVIFIVLGISADNVFVFIDAWRQSARVGNNLLRDSKYKRMAYSFRRASRAIAVTSSTTAAAFFANYFSPIMPIKSFGIFAGILVLINYVLTIMVFPSAVVFGEFVMEKFNKEKADKANLASETPGCAARIFETKWNNMIKVAKYPIIVIYMFWVIYATSQAFQISPLTEREKFVPDYIPEVQGWRLMEKEFRWED